MFFDAAVALLGSTHFLLEKRTIAHYWIFDPTHHFTAFTTTRISQDALQRLLDSVLNGFYLLFLRQDKSTFLKICTSFYYKKRRKRSPGTTDYEVCRWALLLVRVNEVDFTWSEAYLSFFRRELIYSHWVLLSFWRSLTLFLLLE